MAIEHLSPNKVSDILSVATPTLMGLPNELLLRIVEFLGPPDLSCCDPGWLVVPAICRRFKEVAGKIRSWESGSVNGPNGARAKYGWNTFSPDGKRRMGMPPGTPDKGFWMDDEENNMSLGCHPSYKGGGVEYFNASLSVSSRSGRSHKDAVPKLNRYFHGSAAHVLPRLNLSWLNSIRISVHHDQESATHSGFSSADVPCIVAPALEELYLQDYIIDWRCTGLKKLRIGLIGVSGYRYPPSQLLRRLHDSRCTLEEVWLADCLSPMPNDDQDAARVPVHNCPRLRDFLVHDGPREAGWLCSRVSLPPGRWPSISGGSGADLAYLRSLAGEYRRSAADPDSDGPGFRGEPNALTIRAPDEYDEYGCYVTASKIPGVVEGPDMSLELYAKRCIARYIDYDREQAVRELDGMVPGINPVFVTQLDWSSAARSMQEGDDRGTQHSGLEGIEHLFFDGLGWRLVGGDAPDRGVKVWTEVLRQLPSVRSLYIYDPCPAALAPLINEPDLLPNLETLWIGRDTDIKGDGDLAMRMPEDDCYGSEDGYSSDFDHEDEVVKRQIAASDDDAASLEDGEIPDDEHVSGPGGDAKPDVGSGRVDDSKDNGTSGDGASKPDGSIPKARTSPKWFCKIDAEGLLKIARDRDLRCTLENVEIVSDDPRALEKALSMFGENGP